ncbi:MAG: class A beta-lactamase-related serine hydrolase [Clostridiales bacterium]|jgi:beta-lactamase class A|nr:class A beta-lactamase-related serine hydrolase [Clostridiales bacterium]
MIKHIFLAFGIIFAFSTITLKANTNENLISMPDTHELETILRQYGNNISLLYQNLETGFVFTYNPEQIHFAASVTKWNHALYVYTLAERELISMDAIHVFREEDRRGGTGRIQNMEAGTRFTTRELLSYSMLYSDNVAYRMLIRATANAQFSYADYVNEIGANPDFIGNIATQNTTVSDTAIWLNAANRYMWSDGAYCEFFRNDLLATPSFIQSDYPVVNKYGWANPSFNDAAIIYAPSPYILIILSNYQDGAAGIFRNISMEAQNFNDAWFNQ